MAFKTSSFGMSKPNIFFLAFNYLPWLSAKFGSIGVVGLTIALGLFLRVWRLEELAGFDFDQETAAWWIKSFLIDGKFSLIGQEISVGGLFIGPVFYYLLSVFYFVFGLDPIAGNVTVSIIALITMALVFVGAKSLFGLKTGLLALFLYAFSSSVNFYDRTVAPSNVAMLISCATLYFLLQVRRGVLFFVLIGIFLGLTFSVHPGAVVLIFIVLVYFVYNKHLVSASKVLATLIPISLFLFPLIIFDLRHSFLNTLSFISILSRDDISPNSYPWMFGLLINLRTVITSLTRILLPDRIGSILWTVPVIWFLILSFFKNRSSNLFLILWFSVSIITLSFYRGVIPEYYFLILFPVFLIHFSHYLINISASKKVYKLLIFALVFFSVVAHLNSLFHYRYLVGLAYKKQAVKYVIEESGGKDFQVDYVTTLGQNTGFNYLFYWYKRLPVGNSGVKYIIVLPMSLAKESGAVFGDIKVLKKHEEKLSVL